MVPNQVSQSYNTSTICTHRPLEVLQRYCKSNTGSLRSVNFSRDNRQSKLLKIKGEVARSRTEETCPFEKYVNIFSLSFASKSFSQVQIRVCLHVNGCDTFVTD